VAPLDLCRGQFRATALPVWLLKSEAHSKLRRYMSWFKGAETNVAFSAVDVPALASFQGPFPDHATAFEAVRANADLQLGSRDFKSFTRSELLRAVLACGVEIETYASVALSPLTRAYVHAMTGIEQVIVCLSFARKAVCYTCTALDVTDESLVHRFCEFAPAVVVASSDTVSGVMRETAAGRCQRLFPNVSPCKIAHGSAETWLSLAPRYVPPVAVVDSFALTVVFTSGSTGKPKGLVHGHGGYGSCVARSMSYVFGARAGRDVFLTLATFAWITGQSYMLYGPALSQCTSLLLEGSPLGSDGLRWARVAKARGATVLKCASAFVRHIMGNRSRRESLESLDLPNSLLRLGTFCAEPLSVDVQQWASTYLIAPFLNSYWATEHGSIILSRDPGGSYQPDTKCWPVPWVKASLLHRSKNSLGEFVLDVPYAGLARTVFANLRDYGAKHWHGDLKRFKMVYFPTKLRAGNFDFVQGDAARAVADAFTFHGRHDEVLNVLGVRVGLEELEKVAWRVSGGTVQDLAIVGAPDTLKGQVPVGWVVLCEGATVSHGLLHKWRKILRDTVGVHAEPNSIIAVGALPKTITGKTQRGLLQAALEGKIALHPAAAARAVSSIDTYAHCYTAAQRWRLCEAFPFAASLKDIIVCAWRCMGFNGHDIGGTPLLPAAGWLCILSHTLSHAPVGLGKVQLLQGVRDMHQVMVLRKHARNLGIVEQESNGVPIIKCEFHEPALVPLGGACSDKFNFASSELLEDIDRARHYHRCSAVGLRYSGTFKCVTRVIWRTDWCFKALVSATSVPALLDAPLQIVCSLDALGRGATFIPFFIERFEAIGDLSTSCPYHSVVIGRLTARDDSYMQCDVEIYAADSAGVSILLDRPSSANLIATMEGIKFTKVNNARQPQEPTGTCSDSSTDLKKLSSESDLAQKHAKKNDRSLLHSVMGIGSDLIGTAIDPSKSLFENGFHSLRAVELIGKINQSYGVNLNAAHLASEETFAAIAAALKSEIDAQRLAGLKRQRFSHIDSEALQRIVDARLAGAEAPGVSAGRQRSALAEAARGVIYMVRRGFLKYLRIQYHDGLFRFLISTPSAVDLDRTVVVPGSSVRFEQTDYNRHFTVREIVLDSERGFYNLIHASGLAHLEHYFRVMFFASRLEARFDAELLEGEAYEMRCKITNITGPLVDAEVAFYSLKNLTTRAFIITWRLMLVIDPSRKLMYDFERGGAFGDIETKAACIEKLSDVPAGAKKKVTKKSETWTLTRRGHFITSGSIAFFGVLIGMYAMAPVAVRILIPLPLVVADVLKDLKPREAIIIFTIIGFWLRTHPGRKPLDGPVDMLLPHG